MDSIKKQALKLRDEGKSYSEISSLLSIPRPKVVSIIQRSENCCKECGKPIIQTKGHRQKKFCSTLCRVRYHRSMSQLHKKKCLCCSKEFYYVNSNRKFCSAKCYTNYRFHQEINDESHEH